MNRLHKEQSPYLRQHAHNPVDWYPWGREAFGRAKQEDKPILLSIGYSTCHWCHVMERESFTDPATASVMNENFVCIKLDREERPDLDHLYITAVSALIGSAGWPLNVFLTPDRKPFFGGTYFPPTSRPGMTGWTELLRTIAAHWARPDLRKKLTDSAEQLTGALAARLTQPAAAAAGVSAEKTADSNPATEGIRAFKRHFDDRWGGFGSAPKFPQPPILDFLLTAGAAETGEDNPKEMVFLTLDRMAEGGIYDQLGGGFHRYSTDRTWHLPHFEKMLYDNGQLLATYSHAFRLTGNHRYERVIRETADYLLRDMRHPEGGFFSAEDADSPDPAGGDTPEAEKREGAFYVFTAPEMRRILESADLPDAYEVIAAHFAAGERGNVAADPHGEFSRQNVLYRSKDVPELADTFHLPEETIQARLAAGKSALFRARNRRPRPHLDDKVITAWNGMAISGFCAAARALKDERYLAAAEEAADFIERHLYDETDDRLFRIWREGERNIPALADDYAFLIRGLIDLYGAGFRPDRLSRAIRLAEALHRDFFDAEGGGFFHTRADHDEGLILRTRETRDGVNPSANSAAAEVFRRLADLTGRGDFREIADRTLRSEGAGLKQAPDAYPGLLREIVVAGSPTPHIIIAGDRNDPKTTRMIEVADQTRDLGGAVLLVDGEETRKALADSDPQAAGARPVNGGPAAYVCAGNACRPPVTTAEELSRLLDLQ